MQDHIEVFFAQVEAETGSSLPNFVKDEFDAFLECADCAHEKLVAFSCKRRGFCPSCGRRRMAQTAAHLVDHVIPNVPRVPMGSLTAISTFLIKQAGLKRRDAQTGAITLIQRFGSAANLKIHLHFLVLDGVYRIQNDTLEFRSVRSPTADQRRAMLSQIIQLTMKALTYFPQLIPVKLPQMYLW